MRSYVGVLWRHKWVVLACVLLLPLAVYAISSRSQDVYRATANLEIQAQSTDTSPGQALASAARITTTLDVATRANRLLKPPATEASSLLGEVKVTTDRSAGFLTIAASDTNPRRAADIANAFAVALVQARSIRAGVEIGGSVADLETALAQLPAADQRSRAQLSQQLQRLRAVRSAQFGQIVERARPPTSPVSPRPLRNAAIAFVIGGLIGVGLAFLLDRYDRRIRHPAELEALTTAPLLAAIPLSAEHPSAAVEQAFQMLAANLTSFNPSHKLRCVLVASPLEGDGKTTVAVQLAQALARTGKDVILVDADLRDPTVDSRFGHSFDYGLGAVLRGEAEPEDVFFDVDIKTGRLRILPAGSPVPNPSRLIASGRLGTLFTELRAQADIVVIDSAPALIVGDTIPLIPQVSGVLMVGRVGWTRGDAFRRLVSLVENASGKVLGLVAIGVRTEPYGYGAYGGDASRWRTRLPSSSQGEPEQEVTR